MNNPTCEKSQCMVTSSVRWRLHFIISSSFLLAVISNPLSIISNCSHSFGNKPIVSPFALSPKSILNISIDSFIVKTTDSGNIVDISLSSINVGFGNTGTHAIFERTTEEYVRQQQCLTQRSSVTVTDTISKHYGCHHKICSEHTMVKTMDDLRQCISSTSSASKSTDKVRLEPNSKECETAYWMQNLRKLLIRFISGQISGGLGLHHIADTPMAYVFAEIRSLDEQLRIYHERKARTISNTVQYSQQLPGNISSKATECSDNIKTAIEKRIFIQHTLRDPLVWAVRRIANNHADIICRSDVNIGGEKRSVSNLFHILECAHGSRHLSDRLVTVNDFTGLTRRDAQQYIEIIRSNSHSSMKHHNNSVHKAIEGWRRRHPTAEKRLRVVARAYIDFNRFILSHSDFDHYRPLCVWDSSMTDARLIKKIHQLPRRPAPKVENISSYQSRAAIDYFNNEGSYELKSIIADFMAIPNNYIWSVVRNISEEEPYFFFHARKAGGSTLRGNLYVAAKELGLSAFIACERGVNCDTYHIPTNESFAVYGLHLQWGELKVAEHLHRVRTQMSRKIQSIQSKNNDMKAPIVSIDNVKGNNRQMAFSCFTNLRDPVGRLLSCVEFRYLQEPGRFTNASCIADVSVQELYHLLAEEVDDYSNSCLNEPFRVFSGLHDEDAINSLGLHFDTNRHLATPKLNSLSNHIFRQTLMRYAHCVPYILEYPQESTDLLAYKFPQLYDAAAYRMDRATNTFKSRCSRKQSNANRAQMTLLEHFAAYERVLYDAVVQKLVLAHKELMSIPEVSAAVTKTKNSIVYSSVMAPLAKPKSKPKAKPKSKPKAQPIKDEKETT